MWHYLPDAASPSVQAAADLTWVLSLPARALPPPHMSSGRTTPAKHSSPRSERNTSHPLRSGETSGSSTPDPSAGSSTPLLPDTHVSRFPKRDRERARTTRAISGRTSPASLMRAVPNGPSSKMSPATSPSALRPCCESYGEWASRLRLACSQRKKQARRMSGSESSSWPTARASEQENRTIRRAPSHGNGHGEVLAGVACDLMANWPTPMAGTPAQNGNNAAGNSDFSRRAEELAAQLWMTPTPTQTREGQSAEAIEAARRKARESSGAGNGFGLNLGAQVGLWGTPRGSDGEKGGPNQAFGAGGTPLPAQAANWPTPAAHEPRLGVQNRSPGSKGQQLSLSTIADRFPRPAPGVARPGPRSSPTARTMRPLLRSMKSSASPGGYRALLRGHSNPRLNPLFVEWLMGWPPGHALCDCSATEFIHWQRHMRSALSRLPMASGAWIWKPPTERPEPEQMSLL